MRTQSYCPISVKVSRSSFVVTHPIQVKAQDIELCGGSNDAVPRELVNPETSELIQVTKFYYANAETKGMKKEDSRSFIDKRGNEYIMDYHGWVTPKPAEEEKAGE